MASVNLEFSAYLDPRFRLLGKLSDLSRFDAIGRMGAIWVYCVEKGQAVLGSDLIDALTEVEGYSKWVVEAGLGEPVESNRVRIRGTEGRIEYLEKARERQKLATAAAKRAKEEAGNTTQATMRPKLVPTLDPKLEPKSDPSLVSSSASASSSASTNNKNQRSRKDYSSEFERLYQQYPRKEGKSPGYRIYLKQIQSPEDVSNLESAIRNYTALCRSEGRDPRFVMHFGTFMNCWRDYLEVSVTAPRSLREALVI